MQLVAVDYQAENAQEEFVKSLRETGFGVLKKSPYPTVISSRYLRQLAGLLRQ